MFSKHKDYVLSDDILNKLNTKSDYLDFFDSKVTFIEDVRTAEQFETYMTKAMLHPKRGKFVNGEYIEANPEKYTIVIFDNYNVIANSDKYNAIHTISASVMIPLRNIYKCTCVGIVQQAPDQESRNAIQANQVEPSIAGIQHNKAVAQDSNLNLGLFAPDRYEHIRTRLYRQYTVAKFGDYLRFIMVLPSRNGGGGAVCPIFFNGGTGEIFELPRPDDKVGLSKVYAYIDKLKKLESYAATD